jgi:hypothetical protein
MNTMSPNPARCDLHIHTFYSDDQSLPDEVTWLDRMERELERMTGCFGNGIYL